MRYRPKQIDTKSGAYSRIIRAGFELSVNREDNYISGSYLPIILKCVCGTTEYGAVPSSYATNGKYDAAAYVEDVGAVSIKHLKNDGYNTAQIKNIRSVFI